MRAVVAFAATILLIYLGATLAHAFIFWVEPDFSMGSWEEKSRGLFLFCGGTLAVVAACIAQFEFGK